MAVPVCTSKKSFLAIAAVLLLSLVSIPTTVKGQTAPSCVSNLVPCLDYLNSTNPPPSSCCNPLREAVSKDLACLCNLYDNTALINQFRINITQAVALPGHCGIRGDLCNKAIAPTPSSVPPPGVPGNDGIRLGSMSWTGMSGLLLLCASVMLY